LFQAGDYIPVDPNIGPLEPSLRPDGQKFRATYFTPEEIDADMPRWHQMFKDMFR
jgi:hypothetical protein